MGEFDAVFGELRNILAPYAATLLVQHDSPGNFYLNTTKKAPNGTPLMFGATQVKKSYVSYYLFPVYMFPELLEGMSPGLKKRMQGKSCFNFKQADPKLIAELTTLTRRGYERFEREGLV